jgi:hypothetical protein
MISSDWRYDLIIHENDRQGFLAGFLLFAQFISYQLL